MASLLLFVFATIGLTNILVHGRILDVIKLFNKSIREWLNSVKFISEILACYECTGWWSGLFNGCLAILYMYFQQPWLLILPYAFAGSLLSGFYSEYIYMIRSKTDFVVNSEENGTESKE
jgi:hypothetical protein